MHNIECSIVIFTITYVCCNISKCFLHIIMYIVRVNINISSIISLNVRFYKKIFISTLQTGFAIEKFYAQYQFK